MSFVLFGASINITSCTITGEADETPRAVEIGEIITVNIEYNTVDTIAPILFFWDDIYINSTDADGNNEHYTQIKTVGFSTTQSVPNSTNIVDTLTFVLQELPENNTRFTISIRLKDSGNPQGFPVATDITFSNQIDSTGEPLQLPEEAFSVELSSFDAVITASNFVSINWTVQSETNISGYYVLRGIANSLSSAELIPSFIPAINTTQEHSYSFVDNEVENNSTYFYWLKSVEFSNETEYFGPAMVTIGDPNFNDTPDILWGTQLQGNYPNPFNPTTDINFSVEKPQHVTIDIYNIRGQLVKSLYSNHVSTTNQFVRVQWNGKDNAGESVASGIYYTRMKAGSYHKIHKMLLSK